MAPHSSAVQARRRFDPRGGLSWWLVRSASTGLRAGVFEVRLTVEGQEHIPTALPPEPPGQYKPWRWLTDLVG